MSEPALPNRDSGSNRKRLVLTGVILFLAWTAMTFLPLLFKNNPVRFLADNTDRGRYFEIGSWLTEGTPPVSEYPQIPTLLFGVNRLVSTMVAPGIPRDVDLAIFSLEMLLVLFFVLKILLEVMPAEFRDFAFLVLLPPTLFFTYNRFDILPAGMCLAAFAAATKKRWAVVSIILALGTFTKWYPALLFPGFLAYATSLESKFQWKMVFLFCITAIGVVLLSFFYGGFEAVLAPYQSQMARVLEPISFPVLMDNLIHKLSGMNIRPSGYLLLLLILQVSGPVLVLMIRIKSLDALIHYCIAATGGFILFSRIWSPQWFLWFLPFLLLSVKSKRTAGLIVAYNLITYLCFPLFFDVYGESSYPLKIAGFVAYLILIATIVRSIWVLKREGTNPRIRPA